MLAENGAPLYRSRRKYLKTNFSKYTAAKNIYRYTFITVRYSSMARIKLCKNPPWRGKKIRESLGSFTRLRWSSTTFSLYLALHVCGSNTFLLHDFYLQHCIQYLCRHSWGTSNWACYIRKEGLSTHCPLSPLTALFEETCSYFYQTLGSGSRTYFSPS
jgi:hypothetical protein